MNLTALGILPRLGLALIPWLAGEVADSAFDGCFFSTSPFCIYYFHPPGMDVLFALLVLAPFMATRRLVALRLLALVGLSVAVHALSVELLTSTRGLLVWTDVDSSFLNMVPIALVASIATVSLAGLACGLRVTARLVVFSALAGMPVALVFLVVDVAPAAEWMPLSDNWYWAVWHLSICTAFFYGRQQGSGPFQKGR